MCFVSGHDFSRAVTHSPQRWALAPVPISSTFCSSGEPLTFSIFSCFLHIQAVFGGAVEIERGAALLFGGDALAEFVFVNLRRNGRLRDFRQRETNALLHVENRVLAENERNALILPGRVFVLLRMFGKQLVKDNRGSGALRGRNGPEWMGSGKRTVLWAVAAREGRSILPEKYGNVYLGI